jgi:nucleoside phosphorylase
VTAGTVVVLTALDAEHEAVRALLHEPTQHRHDAGTLFEVGTVPGRPGRVALAVTGVGNQAAATLTERAITEFRPLAVLFVGIAGALHDDLELGSVVAATRVYGYHGGIDETGNFRTRPEAWEADHELEQLAREVKRTGSWLAQLDEPADQPFVHFRPIAAGEVVLNSRTTSLAEQLRNAYADAAAIDMESAGAAKAAHLRRTPFMTVRAISDKADGHKHRVDATGSQPVAAARAAAFAVALARAVLVSDTRRVTGPAVATRAVEPVDDGESAAPPTFDWESYALVEPQALVHVADLVAELADSMASTRSTSAITVSGAGGLGKTAVTHAAVLRVSAEEQFSRVVWASAKNTRFSATDVGGVALDSIYWHDVLRIIAEQLGYPLPPHQPLWEYELSRFLAHDLHGARVLVVIDNLEFVRTADRVIGRLRDLGLRHPHKVVATTRWAIADETFEVRDFGIPPLTPTRTYDLVRLLAEGAGSDLGVATNDELAPIYEITEGNPFLIRLIARRFIVTGRSLDRVIGELGTATGNKLGNRVRAWLFDQSLDELRARSSQEQAVRLLFTFCVSGRGGSLTYEQLRAETDSPDDERFDDLLETACRLGLVRPSNHNRRYSIHSLLYQYTCPLAWHQRPD